MNADQFALSFKCEMERQLDAYSKDETAVGTSLKKLNLNAEQSQLLEEVVRQIAIDSYYTVLLALDGAVSLNGNQQCFSVTDEKGCNVYSSGELEAAAWEAFHG